MSPEQFDQLFQEVVQAEFPASSLAYSEIGNEVAADLVAGREGNYLNDDQPEPAKAELEFGAVEALATIGATVPVLQLAKIAAESYLFIRRHRDAKEEKSEARIAELEHELELSLSRHLGRAKARSVAATVASKVARVN